MCELAVLDLSGCINLIFEEISTLLYDSTMRALEIHNFGLEINKT